MSKYSRLWEQMNTAFFFATDANMRAINPWYDSDEVAAYMAGGEL
jgi:hypothetical protein